ncbi:MAG: ATP-binding protein [Prolixibacteraceae bacterium]|nr:ATP-binding protein [Prolixibacteraceae bacterium]
MINKKILQGGLISKLTILSDKDFIPLAQNFVVFNAKLFGFKDSELQKIELITEEAILSTIENSFEHDEPGLIDVRLLYRPGEFVISVEDKGIPVDLKRIESQENSSLGILLIKNLADEFNFINLGNEGKRLEMIKYLPEESISNILSQDEKIRIEGESSDIADDKPFIRLITTDDAEMLSRLAYRVYGYTYISIFYYPEKIRELIENKLMVSAVAVNNEDEIVGSLSLFFEVAGDVVADSGAAMVDPRYRGHKLFKEMKYFLRDYGINNGMYGIYSEAVTIHPFTQQGNISLGAHETGIMLAYASEKLTFKKIGNEVTEQKQSVVLFFLRTNKEPHRTVYLNKKFYPILQKIYEKTGLDREIIIVDSKFKMPESDESTLMSSKVKTDFNVALISLKAIGKDAFGLIMHQLKEFCLKKIDTIYLEMPVSNPDSAILSKKLNESGFLLCGIVPEFYNGDYIKMQYLNNVSIDPAKIVIASDIAGEILKEIMKDYK